MTTTRMLALVLLLGAGTARAEQPVLEWRWTRTDLVLEGAALAAIAADCLSTVHFRKRHDLPENNPLLGRWPSNQAIWAWCGAAVVAHVTLALVIPRPLRAVFQVVTVAVEGGLAWHNWTIRGVPAVRIGVAGRWRGRRTAGLARRRARRPARARSRGLTPRAASLAPRTQRR